MDGSNSTALFNGPYGIVIDSANVNLFVSCVTSSSIRRVVVATGVVTTVSGASIGVVSPLLWPRYVRIMQFIALLRLN